MKERDISAAIRTCKATGCSKGIRLSNKSGYCSKHFYFSKLKHARGAVLAVPKRGPAKDNGHGKIELTVSESQLLKLLEQLPLSDRIGILVSEEQLTRFFTALPLNDRAAIVSSSLAGVR